MHIYGDSSARGESDNVAQQPAKWTSERDMLGNRVPQALFLSLISPLDGPPWRLVRHARNS